jgi:hypothetical protein
MLLRSGRLESDQTERASGEALSKPANPRSLIHTAHLNSVTHSQVTLLLYTVQVLCFPLAYTRFKNPPMVILTVPHCLFSPFCSN